MGPLTRLARRLANRDDRERFDNNEFGRVRLAARVALRFKWVYAGLLVFSCVVTASAAMDIYHRTEMPEFCGACHEMGANLESWRRSQHGAVKCVECHAAPGLTGWMSAKMDGMKQLIRHFSADSLAEIRANDHARKITSANCERCHPGALRVEERNGLVISHRGHRAIGAICVSCHDGKFAHPPDGADASRKVDTGQCFHCHDGATRVGERVAFEWRSEDNCTRCHPDAVLASQHGSEHSCTECHGEPPADGHFAMPADGNGPVCATCHDKETDYASMHEPYAKDQCEKCHLVMSGAYLYRTGSTPSTALCLGCHEDLTKTLASDATTTGAFANGTTDLHRAHAGYVEDEPAWCGQCHAPHGSSASRALIAFPARAAGGEQAPGVFAATDSGGSCSGACHTDDTRAYERPTKD